MEKIISYEHLAWIAGIETITLIILCTLIAQRKIGRPLTQQELDERRRKREAGEREEQERWNKLQEQEQIIKNLQTPVTFVSLSGNDSSGISLSVQDGKKKLHAFHADSWVIDNLPFFNGLYQASREPNYKGERGAILLQ